MTDPKLLPVWQSRKQILDALKDNQVIIVESPTGSGKTTQIPLILNAAGYTENGIIGITQPRRIATLSVCSYIKDQISNDGLPEDFCAYKMRFYDTTGENTKIKILTDGMLLQELKTDPYLSRYSVIMVDEAHERSLNIDFILGLLKQILKTRRDLKVIISSATLNTKAFSRFFKNNEGLEAPIISIDAKIYKVETRYYPPKRTGDRDELSHSICQIINVLLKRFAKSGWKDNEDTLIFLPGEFEIKTILSDIYANCDYSHLQIYPLYGRLNKEEQELVFEETQSGKMKVVLATNIAETSLTIDGIKAVIDSGLSKINFYNQFDFTSSLVTKPISRSSAMQRSGRAGRTSDGICYRLYSKEDFQNRSLYTQEEILRTDLSEVVLRMVDLGITDFEKFPYITRPERKALKSGEMTLRMLGAIDEDRSLTEIGRLMVRYPLLPRHSRCIAHAIYNDVQIIHSLDICISFLSCKTPFVLPAGEEDNARSAHRRYSSPFGDFISNQILYRRYTQLRDQKAKETFCHDNYLDFQSMEEIVHVTEQLDEITSESGLIVDTQDLHLDEDFARRLLTCLCSGLIQYVCVKTKGNSYRTLNTDEIYIHPGSAWFKNQPTFLLAGEIVMTTKMYARSVSPIKLEYLDDISKDLENRISNLARNSSNSRNDDNQKSKANRLSTRTEDTRKTYSMYGYTYPVIYEGKGKSHPVAVIDHTELPALSKTYRKASRHPKSINCAIRYKGYYIAYDEHLRDIIMLSHRLRFDDSFIIKNPTKEIFYPQSIENLTAHLKDLMKFSPLTKYRDRLGFIELVCTTNAFFLHVNSSFSEAINNSAYSLLTICDNTENRSFRDAYNRIVKLLD